MHSPLHKPFPYRATAKLQRDLKSKLSRNSNEKKEVHIIE